MRFLHVVVISGIFFLLWRLLFIGINALCNYFTKSKESNPFSNLLFSIGFWLFYILIFVTLAEIVIPFKENNSLEWYCVCCFIGIASVIWCYFDWELDWKAKPTMAISDKNVTYKKIIVYMIALIITLVYGYWNVSKILNIQDMDIFIAIVNATILPSVIATDRILNQIRNFKKKNITFDTVKKDLLG